MAKAETKAEDITMSNTKKEMLAAYKELVKRLEERRKAEAKPAQKVAERARKEAVAAADALSAAGIGKEIGNLKSEIGKMLAQLSDKLEEEIAKYLQATKAVATKEQELREIYEIEREASSLTALIEAQREKRRQFEADMAEKKANLEQEILSTREAWTREKELRDARIKERTETEKKNREREAEEYKYRFEREKKLAREQYDDEKARLDREIALKKEAAERDIAAREQALVAREAELDDLRKRAGSFPKELETAVAKAVQETTERLTREGENREALMKKDAESEKTVLTSRIEALQQTVKEQAQQIARLSAQIEKSYGQVQDIAVKAIEGSSNAKAVAALQAQVADSSRRARQEEK